MKVKLTCQAFHRMQRNTLKGFADIAVAELQLAIKDVAIHEKNNSRWAALPSKPMLKDGSRTTPAKSNTCPSWRLQIAKLAMLSRRLRSAPCSNTPPTLSTNPRPPCRPRASPMMRQSRFEARSMTRPIYLLRLQSTRCGADDTRQLRAALMRRLGLRCLAIEEAHEDAVKFTTKPGGRLS
jgi:hypothetical protein